MGSHMKASLWLCVFIPYPMISLAANIGLNRCSKTQRKKAAAQINSGSKHFSKQNVFH